MSQKNHAHDDLREIKKMMEQSTKFLSLSGLSGVAAGTVALLGAAAAWWKLDQQPPSAQLPYFYTHFAYYGFYIGITLLVLALSVGLALYFSHRKSKQHSLPFWSPVAAKLLISLLTPLITGGIFCLILLHHGYVGMIPPAMLVFYGLALIQSKQYSLPEIGSLGLIEVLLGLANLIWLGKGLYFWALGFGVAHIIYGIWMHIRYDRKG